LLLAAFSRLDALFVSCCFSVGWTTFPQLLLLCESFLANGIAAVEEAPGAAEEDETSLPVAEEGR
jgi:hypothetical protein